MSRWVLPHWGELELRAIKTVAVEQWLKTLVTSKFGEAKPLAGGTREKIRGAMSSAFNHAIRWELADRNPITGAGKGSGVRVSAKRERTPDILEVAEMQLLFGVLGVRKEPWCYQKCGPYLQDYAGRLKIRNRDYSQWARTGGVVRAGTRDGILISTCGTPALWPAKPSRRKASSESMEAVDAVLSPDRCPPVRSYFLALLSRTEPLRCPGHQLGGQQFAVLLFDVCRNSS